MSDSKSLLDVLSIATRHGVDITLGWDDVVGLGTLAVRKHNYRTKCIVEGCIARKCEHYLSDILTNMIEDVNRACEREAEYKDIVDR